jgi:hypothetical protein
VQGKIASYYYLRHTTMIMFQENLLLDSSLEDLLKVGRHLLLLSLTDLA